MDEPPLSSNFAEPAGEGCISESKVGNCGKDLECRDIEKLMKGRPLCFEHCPHRGKAWNFDRNTRRLTEKLFK